MSKNLFTSKSILFNLITLIVTLIANTALVLAADVEGLKAQRKVVEGYLQNGQIDLAKAALAELTQNYSSLPEYVKEVHELGWQFRVKGQPETALQIYRDLQQQFPSHERAAWIQKSVVWVYLDQGDMENAEREVDVMFSNFSNKPDFVKHAHELGWEFRVKDQYATALRIYKDLLQNFPQDERAAWIQRSIILAYLEQGSTAKAFEAVEELKNNFQSHPDYINQMERTMDMLIDKNQLETAKEMSGFLLEKFPEHEHAVWFQHYKARSEISTKQIEAADTAVEVMRKKYASQPDYASALSWTAYNYREAGFYKRAIKLNEYVLNLNPDKKIQLRCAAGIARSHAKLGNDEQALATVNRILSNFEDNPEGIMFYLLGVTEDYYEMGQAEEDIEKAEAFFQKAINVAELRLSKYPDVKLKNPDDDASFYNCLGDCYRRMGQYQKAVDCFEKCLAMYPSNKLAWHVQFQIGGCYEEMSENDSFDKSQTKEKAKLAYQKLLEKYPDCKAAKAVQSLIEKD